MIPKRSVVIIVQARLGSTRLPRKVVREVMGKPLLGFLLERLQRVKEAQRIIVATTKEPQDDLLVSLCETLSVETFRGASDNVLERYYLASLASGAETVVRITADCPLMDPSIVDKAIVAYMESLPPVDYLSNTVFRTYPRGMDVEVFSHKALRIAFEEHKDLYSQEHVTPYIYQHPDIFRLGEFNYAKDHHKIRLTVDEEADFVLIKKIIEYLYPINPHFTLEEVLDCLEKHPDWKKINAHVIQQS